MKMLDLFAGTGVGVAAQQLGIEEHGVEIMPEAVASRDAAGFLTPYNDVWEIDKAERIGFENLWASPPCQTFSVAGKGAGRRALDDVLGAIRAERWVDIDGLRELGSEVGDDRTALVLTPLAYIKRYRPIHVALEQVPTVLPVWEAYRGPLEQMGYSVWVGYLNSEQYGVPQTRKRAYLIARLDTVAAPPVPTHSRYYSRSPERLDPDVAKWISMYEALAWGTRMRPYPTIASGHMDEAFLGGSGARTAMRKLSELPEWTHKRPATTLVGSFGADVISAPGYRTAGGPSRQSAPGSVKITEHEASVLQGYPAGFPFQGSKTKRHLQIGNAVPPPVAKAVLETFL